MILTHTRAVLDHADEYICEALKDIRRLSDDTTWQDCAETTEVEVLEVRIRLLKLRADLLDIQRSIGGSA